MSILQASALAADRATTRVHARSVAVGPGGKLVAKLNKLGSAIAVSVSALLDRWADYNSRRAQPYVDQILRSYSDADLARLGYSTAEIGRLRRAEIGAPHHWL